jgi:malonyl-ACP O-methyltransferase BioC
MRKEPVGSGDADPSTTSVRARFSAASSTYDAHARIQAGAAQRLIDLLGAVDPPDRVLEIGCGTGRLTRLLLGRFPAARIDAIDLAPGMVEEASALLGRPDRVQWIVADARRFEPSAPYPLVVAGSSLHWLDPLEASLLHIAGLVAPGGLFAAALMLDGTLEELHAVRRLVAPRKVPLGRLPSAELLRRGLEGSGFTLEALQEESASATCPSVAALLEELRLQGLTGGAVSRAELPLARGEVRGLVEEYERRYRMGGGVRVTYRIGYVVAAMTAAGPGGASPRGRQKRRSP